jgi:hypothetical protein
MKAEEKIARQRLSVLQLPDMQILSFVLPAPCDGAGGINVITAENISCLLLSFLRGDVSLPEHGRN